MIGELAIGGSKGLTPSGAELLRSSAAVRALLGGYGSGKTTSAAIAVLAHALSSPYLNGYGDAHPTIVVLGPSENVIRESSHRAFKQVCPSVLIRREWSSSGQRRILLDSGVEILFRTWGGEFEGLTALGLWLDEAHLASDDDFKNYVGRLRDPFYRTKPMWITGLPEFGWLHEKFGPEAHYPNAHVIHASTLDNQYLLAADVENLRAAIPASQVATYLLGQWARPQHAVYYEWDPGLHLIKWPGDRTAPCHVSIDVGERAGVLFWQETAKIFRRTAAGVEYRDGRGLHVVDELLPERASAKQIMRLVLERGWKLRPHWTRIYVDPATDRDEIEAIQQAAPGCTIVKKYRGDDAYRVDEGIRCVNAAFCDADRWVRLTVYKELPRTKRSLIPSIPRIRRKEKDPSKVHKDNATDHIALDCFRYPVADLLPLKGPAFRVVG